MKVNCPKCNRAYKINDARLANTDLKMRCPQCSQSFVVSKTGETRNLLSKPKTKSKPPGDSDIHNGAHASLRPKPPQIPVPSAGARTKASGKDPHLADTAPDPDWDGETRNAKISLKKTGEADISQIQDHIELSRVATDEYPGEIDLPAPLDAVDLPRPVAPKMELQDDPFDGIDLPTPAATVDLPALKPPRIPDQEDSFSGIDLPTPVAPKMELQDDPFDGIDLPTPAATVDLPALKPPKIPDQEDPFGEIDLPTPAATVDLPALKPPKIPDQEDPFGEIDLPTPAATVDLPALKPPKIPDQEDPFGEIDLTAPAPTVDLPTSGPPEIPDQEDSFGEIDLNSKPSGPLIPSAPPQGDDSFGEIDLTPPDSFSASCSTPNPRGRRLRRHRPGAPFEFAPGSCPNHRFSRGHPRVRSVGPGPFPGRLRSAQ